MPLCGTKKSKKQKRDPSPPYASPITSSIEEKARSVGVPDAFQEKFENLKQELDGAKQKIASLSEEKDALAKKLDTAEQQLKDKAKDVTDGMGMSMLSSKIGSFGTDKVEDLNDVEKKLEEEATQKKAAVEERLKFEEEFKVASQKLDEFKTQAEEAKTKMEDELKSAKENLDVERSIRQKAEEEKEKFKREKDNIETTLAHTKKELDIAKKESHIPRSPTKLPTDEWKSKIESAQAEFEKERALRIEKEKDLTRLINEKEQLAKEKADLANDLAKEMEEKATSGFASITSSFSSSFSDKLSNTEMNFKNDMKKMEDEMSGLKQQLEEKQSDNESLLSRLSSVTASQVLVDNPDITDLSDPNRPQKLSESFSLLYDDEWTDATEAIEKLSNNEEDAPKILMKILMAVYTHCKESAENQLARIEEDIFLPPLESTQNGSSENGTDILKSPTSSKSLSMSKIPRFTSHKGRPALPNLGTEKKTVEMEPNGKDKGTPKRTLSINRVKGEKFPEIPLVVKRSIKEYRKKVIKQVIPVIEREITNKLRTETDIGDKVLDACKPYISRCVELCWTMRVQDPPVVLSWCVPDNKAFSTDVYRAFTESGSHIDYVVWPAMYMYEEGPMLSKGVAQGIEAE